MLEFDEDDFPAGFLGHNTWQSDTSYLKTFGVKYENGKALGSRGGTRRRDWAREPALPRRLSDPVGWVRHKARNREYMRRRLAADPVERAEQREKSRLRYWAIKADPVKRAEQREKSRLRYWAIKADPVKLAALRERKKLQKRRDRAKRKAKLEAAQKK